MIHKIAIWCCVLATACCAWFAVNQNLYISQLKASNEWAKSDHRLFVQTMETLEKQMRDFESRVKQSLDEHSEKISKESAAINSRMDEKAAALKQALSDVDTNLIRAEVLKKLRGYMINR